MIWKAVRYNQHICQPTNKFKMSMQHIKLILHASDVEAMSTPKKKAIEHLQKLEAAKKRKNSNSNIS